MFLLPFLGPEVAQAITGQAPGRLNEGPIWILRCVGMWPDSQTGWLVERRAPGWSDKTGARPFFFFL